ASSLPNSPGIEMTENLTKRKPMAPAGNSTQETAPAASGQRTSPAAIAAGLEYLLEHSSYWDCSHAADCWVGACILIRLSDLPGHQITGYLRRKIEIALDNLAQGRAIAAARRSAVRDDAELIARSIVALRAYGRRIPDGLLQCLGRCRQTDGGFALAPEDWSGSAPDITVNAIHALRTIDRPAEDYLSGRIQSDESQLSTWLSVCAGILDWDKGLAPLPLLNQACRLIVRVQPQSAFEHALLLRSFVRLRLQQAWTSAGDLRRLQLENGSWPGPAPRRPAPAGASLNSDVKNLIPTVTAISALALCESQPGLYFGSDLPRPRRLYES